MSASKNFTGGRYNGSGTAASERAGDERLDILLSTRQEQRKRADKENTMFRYKQTEEAGSS